MDESPSIPPAAPSGDIVARAGRYYRNTRYIMFVLLVGMGAWFLRDGFIKYPQENAIVHQLETERDGAIHSGDEKEQARIATELKKHEFHNDASLLIQRAIGIGLPPLAVLVLLWSLHRSRGEYRLSGTKLSVPGHPTIDLDDIKTVNDDLWDRKGIVWLKYESANAQSGEITLDDFIYERPPTDSIYDRIAEKFGLDEDEDDDGDVVADTSDDFTGTDAGEEMNR